MTTFVTTDELGAFLARPIEEVQIPRAELIIDGISGAIERYTGRSFDGGDAAATELFDGRQDDGDLVLGHYPVTEVQAVTVGLDAGDGVELPEGSFGVTPEGRLYRTNGGRSAGWRGGKQSIRVEYTYGDPEVTADLKLIALTACARIWGNPTALQSENIGNYAARYGSTAQLSDEEKLALDGLFRTPQAR